jgi:hypothetical protein
MGAPATATVNSDITSLLFVKEIVPPPLEATGHAYFQVDAEMYDRCSGSRLKNLRIIDSENREIPYQIVTKSKKVKIEEFFPKLLNNSYVSYVGGRYNSFVLDFGEKKPRPHVNRLTIVTADENFTRRVSVEGSDDQAQWNLLVDDAYIFDFSRHIHSKHLGVEFPVSNFRYFRVKIHGGGEDQLHIDGAKVFRVEIEPAETESWPLKIIEKTEDTETRTTEIILDAGYKGLPINSLALDVSSRNYHRNAAVASTVSRESDEENDETKWRQLGIGIIFNYDLPAFKKTDGLIHLSQQNVGGRYFKLTIQNHDDRPIEITTVTGIGLARRVILPMTGKKPYIAYFGNPKAEAPRYDLAHRMRYIQTESLPCLELLPTHPNPAYIAPESTEPWTERHPELLWIVMGGVIALLALLIFSLAGKTPPPDPQE